MDQADNRPMLKITGLHIRGLKSIEALDLPEDGLFWEGHMPDFMVIGGVNGSGKTTLLNLIYSALQWLQGDTSGLQGLLEQPLAAHKREGAQQPPSIEALRVGFAANLPEILIDFWLCAGSIKSQTLRFLFGNAAFVEHHRTATSFGFSNGSSLPLPLLVPEVTERILIAKAGITRDWPAVCYLPATRSLSLPETSSKRVGELPQFTDFAYRVTSASSWSDSLEGLLYAARWADLNAKENGQPELANHFSAYATAFQEFFEGSKQFAWTSKGSLVVRTTSGAEHGLGQLSAGEKQIIVLSAELLLRWRPGSLILIDEPELHLHSHWQAKLLSMLERFLAQRGGQVILATQSSDLWKMAPEKGGALLGRTAL